MNDLRFDIDLTFHIDVCAACGVHFGMTKHLEQQRRKDGGSFFCPNGHSLSYGKSEAAKLREELARTQGQLTHARDQRDAAEAHRRTVEKQLGASRGQVTKLQKRVVAGVCPCCHRSFQALSRHMKTKHPDFDPAVTDA
jgi:septal ring factor EnvC (AmiA/AmiB activator)